MVHIVKNKDKKTVAEICFLTDRKQINNKKVIEMIKKSLLKCYLEVPLHNKKVAIFSSKDHFIRDKMGGIGADAMQENVISLHIYPTQGWQKHLENSIAHEYSHLAILDIRKWETILDSLIIEGIAETFRDEVIGGKSPPWTKVLSKSKAKILLKKLDKKLSFKESELHQELFFGSKEYEMWSGYSLGYLIVKEFREKNSDLSWKDIMKLSSLDILKRSGF